MKLYSIDDYRIDKFCIDQYRLDNYRMDGAGGGGTIIDHSDPVTVVNSAYTTSVSARPQRLSNGWLVACANDNTGYYINFYKSIDNGATWTYLCRIVLANLASGFAIASYGTIIHCLFTQNTTINYKSFDATTVSGNLSTGIAIDTQTSYGSGCSITANPTNGHLTAAWSSKNSSYPNSFNIRSAKSTDGGATWTKQDGSAGTGQITADNTSGHDTQYPNTIIMSNGNPAILAQRKTNANYIMCYRWTGSVWSSEFVYDGTTYTQSIPSAVVAPNGRIGAAWQGYGATHTSTYHIFFKPSLDNGATWGTLVDVAVGQNASLTVDENNNFYVQYDRGGTVYQKKSTDGVTWGAETEIGTGTNASACSNYDKFTQPLSIWKGASSVLFAGVFEA